MLGGDNDGRYWSVVLQTDAGSVVLGNAHLSLASFCMVFTILGSAVLYISCTICGGFSQENRVPGFRVICLPSSKHNSKYFVTYILYA